MKKTLPILGSFFLLCLFLVFPQLTLEASRKGLLLWFQTLLPTLLPFLILSQMILKSNFLHFLSPSIFCIFCGFLCGYPVGARLITISVKDGQISKQQGQYLLSFCNNVSPMFCLSYGLIYALDLSHVLLELLCIYGTPLLYGLLCRSRHRSQKNVQKIQIPIAENLFSFIDTCIIDSFLIMIKLCGYMMIFSILAKLGQQFLFPHSDLGSALFLSFLEITNALAQIKELPAGFLRQLLGIFSLSFGGLCCMMQTYSALNGSGLSFRTYFIDKLKITLCTLLLYGFCLCIF